MNYRILAALQEQVYQLSVQDVDESSEWVVS